MKYICIRCGNEFEAKHKTSVCPNCRTGTCAVCGKTFELKYPWNQVTCSSKCRGKLRQISGVGKAVRAKAQETLREKYGTGDLRKVQELVGLHKKICKLCGAEFQPDTPRQEYCKSHYSICPICGKQVLITDYNSYGKTCSESCRIELIKKTCKEKYGSSCVLNSEYGIKKARKTNLEKYGTEAYSSTELFKNQYKNTCLERYGVEHPMQSEEIQKKVERTNQEKRGVSYPMQSPEVQEKSRATMLANGGYTFQRTSAIEKVNATNVERYQTVYPTQNKEVQERTKQTNITRYGTEYPACSGTVIRKKIESTNLKKYGSTTPFGSSEVHLKSVHTLQEHYGVSNPMESDQLKKKAQENLVGVMIEKYGKPYSAQISSIRDKISATIDERYGVPWYCMTQDCSQHNYKKVSKPNQLFGEYLSKMSIAYEFEKYVGHTSFDLFLPDDNVLIELNPTYTHNSIGNHWGTGKDSFYHLSKTNLALENGYRCLHIFDWDDIEKILLLLQHKESVYARNCIIREIDNVTCDTFLEAYHLQGTVRNQIVRLGLYNNETLLEVMTFGNPRYNKKYQWELLRLCSHPNYKIIGGASKLFKYFISMFAPNSVISYCDLSKFSGSVYTALGMQLDHKSSPAKVWSKRHDRITDNLLRQRGYDQLFGTSYGKGTSNEALMLENGWLPVYDCGQAVYVWQKSM